MASTKASASSAQFVSPFSCVITCGNLAAKRKPAGVRSRQPAIVLSLGMA